MKKSLIAMAVLAASGVASAQSTVTLGGVADIWFGSVKTKEFGATTSVSQTKIDSGGFNGSRFNFGGSEDLGGGLKAMFFLDQGFKLDSGAQGTTNQMFSRESYVGLSGGFGTVKVGKSWTAFDDLAGATNFSFDSGALAATSYVLKSGGYNGNPANGLRYEAPALGDISAVVSYAFGEDKTATSSASSVTSLAVSYASGPIFAGLAYQVEDASTGPSTKFTRLNGSYDFGAAKLLLTYGKVKLDAADDVSEYAIGVDVPVSSALTVSGGYARSKDKIAIGGVEKKNKGWSLTGKYTLSKRTFVYAGYVSADTEINITTAPDAIETKAFAVGLQHRF